MNHNATTGDDMYRKIDFQSVFQTLSRLQARIDERFVGIGLGKVCQELIVIAGETEQNLKRITEPNYWLRGFVALVISLSILLIVYSFSSVEMKSTKITFAELIQVAEAAVNDLVIIGVAIVFLVSLESRIKQLKVIKSLNELRAIAHVVDMHQLTKDPTEISESHRTASSPQRQMSPYLLKRYLDYSSELLSIIGKIAAVYAQHIPETKVVASVNEIETLTSGISRKIWQKIMILESKQS